MSELRTSVLVLRDLLERRSVYDVLAKQLGKQVFGWLKSKRIRSEYAQKGKATTILRRPLSSGHGTRKMPYHLSYVQVILRHDPAIAKHMPAGRPWTHRGSAGWNEEGLAVRVILRITVPEIEDSMLEQLHTDIVGVIRHELEHGAQKGRGVSTKPEAKRKTDKSGERDWADMDATRGYLLDPAEVEAWSTQVYTMAKRSKVPVTDFIEAKMKQIRRALARRDVPKSDIDKLILDYRKAVTADLVKRYPTAQFKTRSGEIVPASQYRLSRGRRLRSPWW